MTRLPPMVSLLWWVAGWLVAFTLVAVALDTTDRLPPGVSVSGPFVTIRSDRARPVLDRLAGPARAWRLFATAGIGLVALLAAVMSLGVVFAAVATLASPGTSPVDSPSTVLVVPGVNKFLPLSATPGLLVAILVGLVVHEGCHGVLCRIEGIDIDDVGLVGLTFFPVGAFVQPGEEQTGDHGGWTRMFAAGPAASLLVAAGSFLALLVCLSAITPAAGVAVGGTVDNATADTAAIERGDRIMSVDGRTVGDRQSLDAALAEADATIRIKRADATPTVVTRRITVAADDGPLDLKQGATISAVNDTTVRTERSFRAALYKHSVARLSVGGEDVVTPMGVSGRVLEGGALASAGVPTGNATITSLNGTRILDIGDLRAVLDNASAGTSMPVTVAHDGTVQTDTISPQRGEDGRLLVGIVPDPGISGLIITDFGVGVYPAETYLTALSGGGVGDANSVVERVVVFLTLPLATLVGTAPYNFAGFEGALTAAFTIEGPLAALGGGVFTLANLTFWLAWLNVQVALFNCLPLWPLDGGRVLRTAATAEGERLGVADPARAATVLTAGVGVALAGLLLAVVVVPVAF